MNAMVHWKLARNSHERHSLRITGTGDYRIDGIPLAFAGDPTGTAAGCLAEINRIRAESGLDAIVITNPRLITRG